MRMRASASARPVAMPPTGSTNVFPVTVWWPFDAGLRTGRRVVGRTGT
jgi:hypothetical protein